MGIKIDKSEGGEFPVLDLGWYECRIVDIELRTGGEFGDQLLWKLQTIDEVEDVNGDPCEPGLSLWGWSSVKYSAFPSKAYRWTKAVLGDQFSADDDFDSDYLIGWATRVKVDVGTYQKDGEDVTKNKVLDLTASKKYGPIDLGVAASEPEEDTEIPF
jgi:hypothetical protein